MNKTVVVKQVNYWICTIEQLEVANVIDIHVDNTSKLHYIFEKHTVKPLIQILVQGWRYMSHEVVFAIPHKDKMHYLNLFFIKVSRDLDVYFWLTAVRNKREVREKQQILSLMISLYVELKGNEHQLVEPESSFFIHLNIVINTVGRNLDHELSYS